jgi:hypothetical protein
MSNNMVSVIYIGKLVVYCLEKLILTISVISQPKYVINYGDYIINFIFKVFEFSYYYMGVCKMIFYKTH